MVIGIEPERSVSGADPQVPVGTEGEAAAMVLDARLRDVEKVSPGPVLDHAVFELELGDHQDEIVTDERDVRMGAVGREGQTEQPRLARTAGRLIRQVQNELRVGGAVDREDLPSSRTDEQTWVRIRDGHDDRVRDVDELLDPDLHIPEPRPWSGGRRARRMAGR
jgi:hypothetical protein